MRMRVRANALRQPIRFGRYRYAVWSDGARGYNVSRAASTSTYASSSQLAASSPSLRARKAPRPAPKIQSAAKMAAFNGWGFTANLIRSRMLARMELDVEAQVELSKRLRVQGSPSCDVVTPLADVEQPRTIPETKDLTLDEIRTRDRTDFLPEKDTQTGGMEREMHIADNAIDSVILDPEMRSQRVLAQNHSCLPDLTSQSQKPTPSPPVHPQPQQQTFADTDGSQQSRKTLYDYRKEQDDAWDQERQKLRRAMPSLHKLGVHDITLSYMASLRISEPNQLQMDAFDPIAKGRNVLISSETGSGKTFAASFPVISSLLGRQAKRGALLDPPRRPIVVVLVPTKELGAQHAFVMRSMSRAGHINPLNIISLVGVLHQQTRFSTKRFRTMPTHVLVTTPDLLLNFYHNKEVFFSRTSTLIIDEADIMFTREGFREAVEELLSIMRKTPTDRPAAQSSDSRSVGSRRLQVLLLSAIATRGVQQSIRKLVPDFELIQSAQLHHVKNMEKLKLRFIQLHGTGAKEKAFKSILEEDSLQLEKSEKSIPKTMIFCASVPSCRFVMTLLHNHVSQSSFVGLHSQLSPTVRRNQWNTYVDPGMDVPYLVTTDLGSRGLDHLGTRRVILFDFPGSMTDYMHRVGRIRGPGQVVALIGKSDLKAATMANAAHKQRKGFEEIGWFGSNKRTIKVSAEMKAHHAKWEHVYADGFESSQDGGEKEVAIEDISQNEGQAENFASDGDWWRADGYKAPRFFSADGQETDRTGRTLRARKLASNELKGEEQPSGATPVAQNEVARARKRSTKEQGALHAAQETVSRRPQRNEKERRGPTILKISKRRLRRKAEAMKRLNAAARIDQARVPRSSNRKRSVPAKRSDSRRAPKGQSRGRK
ncbi:DEAD-box ATP-dependent RNA helicase 39 [Porphyridium purpureum]|uniref:DEAD-box ATP-dependent RNA helicase 39 n=1 Tax=Porphyridium purpureum TaxID=35688 RepID=A0A5J4YUY4_PORPP|nr:DEAD-box ATP-dependent RNA helicase 39 [Porphyridium purpureum]|eukprot:POR0679..scf227_4